MEESPLIERSPKERNTGTYKSDDFEDAEVIIEDSATAPPPSTGGYKPDDFEDADSPPMPGYVAADNDEETLEDKNAQIREEESENNRRMLIDSSLEFAQWGIPQGVHWLTKVNEERLSKWASDNYIFAAVYQSQAPAITKTNEKNLERYNGLTKKYLAFIDKPLRQIVRDRQIEFSPEMQVIGATLIFMAWIGYIGYQVRQENQKNMARFEQMYAESMKEVVRHNEQLAKEQAEKAKQQEADRIRNVESVVAEEVHE